MIDARLTREDMSIIREAMRQPVMTHVVQGLSPSCDGPPVPVIYGFYSDETRAAQSLAAMGLAGAAGVSVEIATTKPERGRGSLRHILDESGRPSRGRRDTRGTRRIGERNGPMRITGTAANRRGYAIECVVCGATSEAPDLGDWCTACGAGRSNLPPPASRSVVAEFECILDHALEKLRAATLAADVVSSAEHVAWFYAGDHRVVWHKAEQIIALLDHPLAWALSHVPPGFERIRHVDVDIVDHVVTLAVDAGWARAEELRDELWDNAVSRIALESAIDRHGTVRQAFESMVRAAGLGTNRQMGIF